MDMYFNESSVLSEKNQRGFYRVKMFIQALTIIISALLTQSCSTKPEEIDVTKLETVEDFVLAFNSVVHETIDLLGEKSYDEIDSSTLVRIGRLETKLTELKEKSEFKFSAEEFKSVEEFKKLEMKLFEYLEKAFIRRTIDHPYEIEKIYANVPHSYYTSTSVYWEDGRGYLGHEESSAYVPFTGVYIKLSSKNELLEFCYVKESLLIVNRQWVTLDPSILTTDLTYNNEKITNGFILKWTQSWDNQLWFTSEYANYKNSTKQPGTWNIEYSIKKWEHITTVSITDENYKIQTHEFNFIVNQEMTGWTGPYWIMRSGMSPKFVIEYCIYPAKKISKEDCCNSLKSIIDLNLFGFKIIKHDSGQIVSVDHLKSTLENGQSQKEDKLNEIATEKMTLIESYDADGQIVMVFKKSNGLEIQISSFDENAITKFTTKDINYGVSDGVKSEYMNKPFNVSYKILHIQTAEHIENGSDGYYGPHVTKMELAK